MINQEILKLLWESLDTTIFAMEAGNVIREVVAYCREVDDNVWLLKSEQGLTIHNDMPRSRSGYSWKEFDPSRNLQQYP